MYDEVILCYGLKDYKKIMDKYGLHYGNMRIKNGLCTSFYYEVDDVRKLIIGIRKQDDIDDVKITLLHEVVHAVTFIIIELYTIGVLCPSVIINNNCCVNCHTVPSFLCSRFSRNFVSDFLIICYFQ